MKNHSVRAFCKTYPRSALSIHENIKIPWEALLKKLSLGTKEIAKVTRLRTFGCSFVLLGDSIMVYSVQPQNIINTNGDLWNSLQEQAVKF